jgi:hypothetical protein
MWRSSPGDERWRPRNSSQGYARVFVEVALSSNLDRAMYARAIAQSLYPETAPLDAEWCERYFYLLAPDGHELSFAKPPKN